MDNKSAHRGRTDAQRRAVAKYHAQKIDTLAIRVPKGRKEYYKDKAAAAGVSLNNFAVCALDEKIARDHLDAPKAPENSS